MSDSKLDSIEDPKTDERVRTPAELAEFSFWDYVFLGITYCVLGICYSIILIQILHCVPSKISGYLYSSCCPFLIPNPCLTYIALIFAPLAWLAHFKIWHERTVYNFRLEDPSEVTALIIEARTEKGHKPYNSDLKIKELEKEAERLEGLGYENWTDYQILNLDVMLVDFLGFEDLKARAKSRLEDLRDYWVGTADRYEPNHYKKWSDRIKKGCKKINDIKIDDYQKDREKFLRGKDDAAELLRAELRMLMEHVTDWDQLWAEGSAVFNAIMKFGVIALPHLFGIALIPYFYSSSNENCSLSILSMAVLGVIGSLTTVLLKLYRMYASDQPEVGVTKGRVQLNLAILGTALGLVAGILFYALVTGGFLNGPLFPTFPLNNEFVGIEETTKPIKEAAKAIFWGIASGFSFEMIFNRMKDISTKQI